MDYREQVQQLQREIRELSEASKAYYMEHTHTSQDNHAHQMREERLKQLVNELTRLVPLTT